MLVRIGCQPDQAVPHALSGNPKSDVSNRWFGFMSYRRFSTRAEQPSLRERQVAAADRRSLGREITCDRVYSKKE
jgi:hypothetical protein